MATPGTPSIPVGTSEESVEAVVPRPWRKLPILSSFSPADLLSRTDRFLQDSGFDRGPWLAVFFASGIGLWFVLPKPWQWIAALSACAMAAFAGIATWRERGDRTHLTIAVAALSLALATGIGTIWARSAIVGTEAIERPAVMQLDARILEREEQPAQDRVRLTLATRDAEAGRAIKVRVNVPLARDSEELAEDARIRLRARLMPPAPPILPGAYDFARRAWFEGLAGTGSLIGEIEVIEAAERDDFIARTQRRISGHVREQLGGSPGTIAAAFASGDRGAIAEADEVAMRDAGLTHLLSISGLHVSAVIAAAYFLAIKILALWPWLVLRVRLPLVAAGIAALAGISYTLLTGAQVPTVRSCVGAVLVLMALALGREPLSLRMVAVAAMVVLLLWPESLVGPSFQMSFAAVIAIVALHNASWVRSFLSPREEGWHKRTGRRVLMLFLTGLLIELALMPIVLFHFHRAGVYGAFANVLAIPLVTFVSMPLIALALFLDTVGLGAPAWWLVGQSLDALLELARMTSSQPGSVKLMPQMSLGTLLLFVGGALWVALWRGRARLLGLLPVAVASVLLALTPTPDILVSRDGRHVGISGEAGQLLVLRDSRSSYARDNLLELAGVEGEVTPLTQWPGAQCSRDFCLLSMTRGGREWSILMARSKDLIAERQLAAACDSADIVIAERYLPRSCKPRWLKADRRFLDRRGGLSLFLGNASYIAVADSQGEHGWWRGK